MGDLTPHTPGPWEVDSQTAKKFSVRIRAPRIGTRSNPNPAVATIHTPRSWGEGEANANLIAAAPDLLAALEMAASFIRNGIEFGYIERPVAAPEKNVLPMIEAAIAKAKGGTA